MLRQWHMFKGHTVGRVTESHISGDADTWTQDDGAQMESKSTQMWRQRADVSEGRSACLLCQSRSPSNMSSFWLLCRFETRSQMNQVTRRVFHALRLNHALMSKQTTGGWMDGRTKGRIDGQTWPTDWRWLKSLQQLCSKLAAAGRRTNSREIDSVSGCGLLVHLETFLSCFKLLLPSVTPRPLTLFVYLALSAFVWASTEGDLFSLCQTVWQCDNVTESAQEVEHFRRKKKSWEEISRVFTAPYRR